MPRIAPADTVTIEDVARAARVSPGTVSNTLTGERPVADAEALRPKLTVRGSS